MKFFSFFNFLQRKYVGVVLMYILLILNSVGIYANSEALSNGVFEDSGTLVLKSPTSVTACVSSTINFSIEVTDGCSIVWELSTDEGTTWENTGVTSSLLILTDLVLGQNNSYYRCQVTDGAITEVSEIAILEVMETDLYLDAGDDVVQCGNGAQNFLSVNIIASSNAQHIKWSHNGNGYILDDENLSTQYIVNPQDRGLDIVLTVEAWNDGDECVLYDSKTISVTKKNEFEVKLFDGEEQVYFDNSGLITSASFEYVPVKYNPADLEIAETNYKGNTNYISNGVDDDGTISYLLVKINLSEIPIGEDVSTVGFYLKSTVAGSVGSFNEDNIGLYQITENWNSSTVTWNTTPELSSSKIKPKSISETESEENGDVIVTKYIQFDFSTLLNKWYSGEEKNFGFLVKIENTDNLTEPIKFDSSVSNKDYISTNVLFSNSGIYLCKDKELGIKIEYSEDLTYSMSGSGGVNTISNNEFLIDSHSAMTNPDYARSYIISGDEDGCLSTFRFLTYKTPVLSLGSTSWETEGNIDEDSPTNYKVSGITAYNKVGSIAWETTGAGYLINESTINPTYVTSKDDFGKYITLTATLNSSKDCTPEIKSKDLYVKYPLYPYAGEDIIACKGEEITMSNALWANVPNHPELNEEAESYVDKESILWEVTSGKGSFDDNTSLNPTYIPASDDEDLIVCTLTIESIGEIKNEASHSITIHYESDDNVSFGTYNSAVVGETFVFDQVNFGNVVDAIMSTEEGTGVFTTNENGYYTYVPTYDDLDRDQISFVIRSADCDQINVSYDLKILPPINGSIGSDISVCPGVAVKLSASGGERYEWSPTTGLDDYTSANPTAVVSENTTYYVKIYKTLNGKEYYIEKEQNVLMKDIPVAEIQSDVNTVCPNTDINLSAVEGENYSYEWSVEEIILSETKSLLYHITTSSDIKLNVTNEVGCSSEDVVQIEVLSGGDINIGDANCSSSSVDVSSSGYDSYSWAPAELFECSTCGTTSVINPNADQTYVFTGINGECVTTEEFKIPYQPAPIISGNLQYESCPGEGFNTSLEIIGSVQNILWLPATGLSSDNILNPTINVDESISYQLKVTDVNGCVTIKDVDVDVVEIPDLDLEDNISICRGTSYEMKANNQVDWVEWEPEEGVSNPNSLYTLLIPDVTTNYVVKRGIGECFKSEEIKVEVYDFSQGIFNYSYPGLDVVFTALGDADQYIWDFGDGETGSGSQITHTYVSKGNYNVCLKVTGACGSNEHSAKIKVKEKDTVGCD